MNKEQKRILLVEDDETLSKSLATLLEDGGFLVTVAHDGEAAVREAEKIDPDMILLDVMIPKMDGISALKRMREIPALKETPVTMLTNRDDLETINASLESGSFDFLVKHEWRLEDIVKRVQEKLGVTG